MKKLDPLDYLERPDKWYLGGGKRLVWAPPFPLWLNYPGFWDKAHYYNIEIEPVFTWTVLDEDGHELMFRQGKRRWNPARLEQYYLPDGREMNNRNLTIRESKFCAPNDVLTAELQINNQSARRRKLHLIAWSAQPSFPSHKTKWITDVNYRGNVISFTKHFQSERVPLFHTECGFSISGTVESHSIILSEGSEVQPRWMFTPWFETFHKSLNNDLKISGVNDDGLVFMALHTTLDIRPKNKKNVGIFFSAAPSKAEVSSHIHFVSRQENMIGLTEGNWTDDFASVPYFDCSDEYLTRYYWYRWYGLKLNTIQGEEGNYSHPAVCEGIGYFRAPISYSAPCHILENRWRHDPALAKGNLLTFLDNQRSDGGFRGYIDPHFYRQEMFYHANWGASLRELSVVHFDSDFIRASYTGLKKYAEYFDRERDTEGSGLYDIDNHYETGQEYMHRYLAIDPNVDRENWGKVFRLKGVDVATYLYELKCTLSWIAGYINNDDYESARWRHEAEKIKNAILQKMWSLQSEMFSDVDPGTGRQTGVSAATCFYPYMTDIISDEHLPGMKRHLFQANEFWTPYPVPSSSRADELFSATPEWKGKRMNCPWNGRVWPMANSHIAEVIARSAIRFQDECLRKKAAEFISKYIRMMFLNGDPERPNCYEHYNPLTGDPSIYRGIDDYQHSWVVDLIIKYVAGIRPEFNRLIVDPFPFPIDHFVIRDVMIKNRQVRVVRDGKFFRVWIDGKDRGKSPIGRQVCITL